MKALFLVLFCQHFFSLTARDSVQAQRNFQYDQQITHVAFMSMYSEVCTLHIAGIRAPLHTRDSYAEYFDNVGPIQSYRQIFSISKCYSGGARLDFISSPLYMHYFDRTQTSHGLKGFLAVSFYSTDSMELLLTFSLCFVLYKIEFLMTLICINQSSSFLVKNRQIIF